MLTACVPLPYCAVLYCIIVCPQAVPVHLSQPLALIAANKEPLVLTIASFAVTKLASSARLMLAACFCWLLLTMILRCLLVCHNSCLQVAPDHPGPNHWH
jgi:hypothetical protein